MTAILAATVHNTFIDKTSNAASVADFMPDWTAQPDEDEDDGEEVEPDGESP